LDSTQDDYPRPLPPNSHFELTGEYQFLLVFPITAPLLDIYGTGVDVTALTCPNLGTSGLVSEAQWTRMTPTPAAIDGFVGYFCDPNSPSN
jgi:hypothetical protein